jgi:hypothetical protein
MFKIYKIFLICFLFSLNLIYIFPEDTKISFKWAFLKQLKDGKIETLDFSKDITLTKDDKFKISITPLKNVYIYLLYLDYNNELSILFPDSLDQNTKYDINYTIPESENEWFQFDNGSGTDKFYLLASNVKLKNLDNLIKEYTKIVESNNPPENKINASKKNIMDEVQNLKNTNSKYTVFAEKPTSIAGTSRGALDKKLSQATMIQVDAEVFYAKILRINH